eukprot:TRINITY_DN53412_c0_g1_i2.p1 TRINITY_DN53412_c0_g1~~TRINITY_DN53412_c0_g1_i2.p1  ORF type:complete len:273 (-),score=4.96 TRINITY_DN53412_c0_g1_i2:108-926(-)
MPRTRRKCKRKKPEHEIQALAKVLQSLPPYQAKKYNHNHCNRKKTFQKLQVRKQKAAKEWALHAGLDPTDSVLCTRFLNIVGNTSQFAAWQRTNGDQQAYDVLSANWRATHNTKPDDCCICFEELSCCWWSMLGCSICGQFCHKECIMQGCKLECPQCRNPYQDKHLLVAGVNNQIKQQMDNNFRKVMEDVTLHLCESAGAFGTEGLNCFVCCSGLDSSGNQILLCDGGDDCPLGSVAGIHQLCASPQVKEIPAGPWLCPSCTKRQQLQQSG